MTKRTPTQDKALRWYVESQGVTPQLSTYPIYYFQDRGGNVTQMHIDLIVRMYKKRDKRDDIF